MTITTPATLDGDRPLHEVIPAREAFKAYLWFATQIEKIAAQRDTAIPGMRRLSATGVELAAYAEATNDFRTTAKDWRQKADLVPDAEPEPSWPLLTGSNCSFCGTHCYVERWLHSGERVYLATCQDGAAFDRQVCGQDHTNARVAA